MNFLGSWLSTVRSSIRERPEDTPPPIASLVMMAARIPTFREAVAAMNQELTRARRYQRPISVLILSPSNSLRRAVTNGNGNGNGNGKANGNGNGNGNAHSHFANDSLIGSVETSITYLLMGAVLRETTRESDLVTFMTRERRFCILLSESDQHQAQRAAQRITQHLLKHDGIPLVSGIAEFPAHGWTLDELIGHASLANLIHAADSSILTFSGDHK